jgi:outer membrane immunogenic protein
VAETPVAGTGFEYAFWRNLTLKAEYLYVNLGSKSISETGLVVAVIGNTPASFNANYNRTSFNIARIGVNYHF